jgi:hypothetical protein
VGKVAVPERGEVGGCGGTGGFSLVWVSARFCCAGALLIVFWLVLAFSLYSSFFVFYLAFHICSVSCDVAAGVFFVLLLR